MEDTKGVQDNLSSKTISGHYNNGQLNLCRSLLQSKAHLMAGGQAEQGKKTISTLTACDRIKNHQEATEKVLKPGRARAMQSSAELPARAHTAPPRALPSPRGDLTQRVSECSRCQHSGEQEGQHLALQGERWGTAGCPARVNTRLLLLGAGQQKYPVLKALIGVWPGQGASCL